MRLQEFAAAMERIAPMELAAEFDNPGLLIEPDHDEISRVLVALDCTKAVAEEAAEWGADLVLTHHPLFFHPVKHMAYSDPATAAACVIRFVRLMRSKKYRRHYDTHANPKCRARRRRWTGNPLGQ